MQDTAKKSCLLATVPLVCVAMWSLRKNSPIRPQTDLKKSLPSKNAATVESMTCFELYYVMTDIIKLFVNKKNHNVLTQVP